MARLKENLSKKDQRMPFYLNKPPSKRTISLIIYQHKRKG